MSTMLLIRETGGHVMEVNLTDAEGNPTELAEQIARTLQYLGVTDAYWRDRLGNLTEECVRLRIRVREQDDVIKLARKRLGPPMKEAVTA